MVARFGVRTWIARGETALRAEVPSFGALPREAWMALGILELVCTVGLIVPAAFHWQPALTVVAATVLTIESLVFVWVHAKYGEITPIILSGMLGSSWRSSRTAALS